MNVKAGDCAVMHFCCFALLWKQGGSHLEQTLKTPPVILLSLPDDSDFVMLVLSYISSCSCAIFLYQREAFSVTSELLISMFSL